MTDVSLIVCRQLSQLSRDTTEFFPGTVYPAQVRQYYAGGYKVVVQYSHPANDASQHVKLLKNGEQIKPIVDAEKNSVKFPKQTVWMTDKIIVPFGGGGRSDKDTWIVKLPERPIAQRVTQQYGLHDVYISEEFVFEDDYRIVTALNPRNPPDKRVEVYFYHQGEQIQPVINHDTRTVSFP